MAEDYDGFEYMTFESDRRKIKMRINDESKTRYEAIGFEGRLVMLENRKGAIQTRCDDLNICESPVQKMGTMI